MAKVKFFDMKNIIVSLKAISVSIVTGLITLLIIAIINAFVPIVGKPLINGVIMLSTYLLTWGYFAKLFWKWK